MKQGYWPLKMADIDNTLLSLPACQLCWARMWSPYFWLWLRGL